MIEVWKKTGIREYEVSNLGRIRNGDFIRKLHKNNAGYYYCGLQTGKEKNVREAVHRLVAKAFHGEPKNKKMTVNHKNGIKTDNRPENLEWMSMSDNHSHAIKLGLKPPPPTYKGKFGKLHNRSIGFVVSWVNGEVIEYESGLDFKRKTGMCNTTISYALRKGLPYTFSRGDLKGSTVIKKINYQELRANYV